MSRVDQLVFLPRLVDRAAWVKALPCDEATVEEMIAAIREVATKDEWEALAEAAVADAVERELDDRL